MTTKQRPSLSAGNFTDAETAAKVLNTKVLVPMYARIEALEKRQIVELTFTTANPVAGTFPVKIPAPFPVKAARLVNAWNDTANAPPAGLDLPIFRYAPNGQATLVSLGLTAATQYTLTFEVSG